MLVALALASPASAFSIVSFDGAAKDPQGVSVTQAGAHPDVTMAFLFDVRDTSLPNESNGRITPLGNLKDTNVDLPAGLIGNPTVAPTCTNDELDTAFNAALCPMDSQVGMAKLYSSQFSGGPDATGRTFGTAPIYNVVPTPGEPAQFAFNVLGVIVRISPSLRADGNYALAATVKNASHTNPIDGASITLWGVPGDAAHDAERFDTKNFVLGAKSQLGRRPFMTNPVSCTGPVTVSMRANTWQDPSTWATASFVSHDDARPANPIGVTGCEKLSFKPSFSAQPTTTQPDSPAGVDVKLGFPQNESPDGLATAQLRDAVVTLPEGMTISPSAADGLQSCTDAQIGFGTDAPVACPDAAKIGTASAVTPLLEEPLSGAIYVGSQLSGDPGSGDMFRIFLVLENRERGLLIKLPGKIRVDGGSGRVQAVFANNPQLPVSEIALRFKGGPRAALATPPTCGVKTTIAELSSWSGQSARLTDSYTVPCTAGLGGFAPAFAAGTTTGDAGAFAPFGLRIDRTDGQQFLDGLTLSLPTGLTAVLKGVPVCSDGEANAGACPESSRVGTATVGSGPGSNPFFLTGGVYLTGPYRGAPIGLAVAVRALAGPFDLGIVVVRQAVTIDRNDAHVGIVSDPLPTIVKGVPLRLRSLNVDVDRRGFMVNPTSCAQKRVTGVLHAAGGASAATSAKFAVRDCASLPFAPKMTLKVGARGKLTRGKRTPLDVTLRMTRAQANNRSVQVTLPLAINARLDVVNKRRACTQVQFDADRCPMVVGTATAVTPLLKDPLRGNAYFVYNDARRLPDLAVRLKGQVDFDLIGKVTIMPDLRLRTTFDAVPDVPITSFRLVLASGPRNGPVGLTRNACLSATRRALKAALGFVGQNGDTVSRSQAIKVAGCGKTSARARGRRRKG